MKKTLITAAITAICFGMTACGNADTGSDSGRNETTTTASAVVTTTTEAAATEAPEVASSLPLTTVPETTSVVTTSPEVTTTPEQVTTTKATEKKTSTTTKKVTTTTKKVTTTAKPKPVTTTKKVTTTAKATTTTKKVTTTAKPTTLRITQSDVDKLVKELQEYSNSKCDFDNLFFTEDEMLDNVKRRNPNNSSWGTPRTISTKSEVMAFFAVETPYSELVKLLKEDIDEMYSVLPDVHFVVYDKWCPNGEAINSKGEPAWEIYLLY